MLPTMAPDRVRVFLSYRAATARSERLGSTPHLTRRHVGQVFRDLIEIDPSADVRQGVDQALDLADILVLLDTFDTAESSWVVQEVSQALARGVPVVWVRVVADAAAERRRPACRSAPEPSADPRRGRAGPRRRGG